MKPADTIKVVISGLVGILAPILPFVGSNALSATERAVTIPQRDVEKLAEGMDAPDKALLQRMFRKLADVISDIAVFTASRGKIRPDGEEEYS